MDRSPAKPALPRNVRLLGWASLLNDVASEAVFPLLPQFLSSMSPGGKLALGLIEGYADSAASLLKLWAGAWSDRSGRRRAFVIGGYGIAGLVRPLIGLAVAPWHVFVARTVDRIGKGIRTAPRDALLADAASPETRGRVFAFHRSMDHLGAAVGPVLATIFLLAWPGRLRELFLWTLVPGLAVVMLLVVGLRESSAPRASETPLRLTLRPFDRNFRLYLASLVLFTLGNSSDAFLLVRAGELGVPTPYLPLLWFAFHVVKSVGTYLSGPAIDRLGPRPLILGGWAMYAALYAIFAVITTAAQMWGAFLAYGVFYALAEPAEKTLVAQLVERRHRGLAYGWFNSAIGITALPASVIFGWLYQSFGATTAFGCGAALAVAAAAVLSMVRTPPRNGGVGGLDA